ANPRAYGLMPLYHGLMNYGVDRYKRPQKISLQEEKARQKSREEYLQSQVNMLWRTLPKREEEKTVAEARRYPSEPQENLLYFADQNTGSPYAQYAGFHAAMI
ncbi:SpoVR family protein, partial [Escherichia sp. TWPC-MK]